MSAGWRIVNGGNIEQPNVSFLHQRTHNLGRLRKFGWANRQGMGSRGATSGFASDFRSPNTRQIVSSIECLTILRTALLVQPLDLCR